jgi:2-dehydro-3-deoxyphosphooctonate aldolase (KDO 8-P synthase)
MNASVRGLFAADAPFFLIAGPCLLEDDALNLRVGETLARLSEELGLPVLFKASFDKANRSRPDAARGPGLERGLERLAAVTRETGLPTLTDVHESGQAAAAADVCAALQVPAFLCRQTDLVEAVAATGRPVNIKKGQWMAPEDMAGAVAKARAAGAT